MVDQAHILISGREIGKCVMATGKVGLRETSTGTSATLRQTNPIRSGRARRGNPKPWDWDPVASVIYGGHGPPHAAARGLSRQTNPISAVLGQKQGPFWARNRGHAEKQSQLGRVGEPGMQNEPNRGRLLTGGSVETGRSEGGSAKCETKPICRRQKLT